MRSLAWPVVLACIFPITASCVQAGPRLASGAWARYELLSTVEKKAPPLAEITIVTGPTEQVAGQQFQWWELQGKKRSGESFAVRMLSEAVPMVAEGEAPGAVKRYLLKEGDERPLEYIDSRNGGALLPKFGFPAGRMPHPMDRAAREGGFAATGSYLGHVVALAETGAGREWSKWSVPTVLSLDPDQVIYMYGQGRDTEGHYIDEGDYHYVPLKRDEVEELIKAGINTLLGDGEWEDWIYRLPVFYTKYFGADQSVKYPEVLYRSNYQGTITHIDEPAARMLDIPEELLSVRRPEDGGFLLAKRIEEVVSRPWAGTYRNALLSDRLRARGINLGTLALDDSDHPVWETMIKTSFYQLQGGAAGVVQEGRYDRKGSADLEYYTGPGLDLSVKEKLLIDYAWMRGAARTFGKDWGMSIYGQCDPTIAPQALTLAYDMGARYFWFWSYDHQHHLPHFMKLKLLKHFTDYKAAHPRKSVRELIDAPRTAIVLPYGYVPYDYMWCSPRLGIGFRNSAGARYGHVFATALATGIACARAGEDFDFTFDIGQDFKGYKRVVKIGLNAETDEAVPAAPVVKLKEPQVTIQAAKPPNPPPVKPTINIPYVEGVAVDGGLEEWGKAEWVRLGAKKQYVSWALPNGRKAPWAGAHDLSALVAFARDETYFYVAARVTDDKHCQNNSGPMVWSGDSLQIALDPMLDRITDYAPDDVEFGLALTRSGPQAYVWQGSAGKTGPLRDAKLSITPRDGQTVYEAAIPWASLTSFPCYLLDYCGVNVVVNDDDGEGRKGCLQLAPGIAEAKGTWAMPVAQVGKVPQSKQPEIYATIDGTSCVAGKAQSWNVALDSTLKIPAEARLDVVLERNGRRTAEGSYELSLPVGRSHVVLAMGAGSLPPGAYRCRVNLVSAGKAAAESSFPVYILR